MTFKLSHRFLFTCKSMKYFDIYQTFRCRSYETPFVLYEMLLIFQTSYRDNIHSIFASIWSAIRCLYSIFFNSLIYSYKDTIIFCYFPSWLDFISSVGRNSFPQLAKLYTLNTCIPQDAGDSLICK